MQGLIKNQKIGFLGVGNMNQAIMSALIQGGVVPSGNMYATNRSVGKLNKVQQNFGVHTLENNEELLDQCNIVLVGVKPQDLEATLEPIASSFTEEHIVISLAAGVPLRQLKRIAHNPRWVRLMPNTAAHIRTAVVGYCVDETGKGLEPLVEELFSPLGVVIGVDEGESFEALTVACGSGIGFVFELMIYWQEWLEEYGYEAESARSLVVQTFLGAAKLAEAQSEFSLTDLQNKVVSKKGVTAAGLQSMQELEVERALRYSFEKAVLRDRELGKM